MIRHLCLATVFAAIPSLFWGQTAGTGAVTGTVTDPSGAVVGKVEVVITSESTGASRRATTGGDGIYRFPLLSPGSYRIEAKASGFKLAVRPGLPVRVTETTGLDIELEIGTQSEVVNVEAAPQLAQTDSSALGRVTEERSVRNLPLVTRNFTQIIGLSPGVSVGLTDASQLGNGNGGKQNFSNEDLSVNGARNYDNNFQMDGVTANDTSSGAGIAIPNPDSIAEFKVLTGQYDSSYGRNAGANVDVITKSGTNQFHGNLFEFFRNEKLNANSFFFNADGIQRGILRQNQYGGTFGGPAIKDKLLFFGSYQGTRQLNGIASGSSSTFVGPPITNDRSAAALGVIYGGQSGTFGGTAVAKDGSNINPVALALLNLKLPDGTYVIPTPQRIVNGQGQYAFSSPAPFNEEQFITNVDYLQSAKSKLTGKFFFANQNSTISLPNGHAPGSPESIPASYRNLSVTHDYTFSPNILNQVEFGFHRTYELFQGKSSFNFPEIGSSVIPQSIDWGYLGISGTENIGGFGNSLLSDDTYAFQDTLTYNRGRHNLRFGAGVIRTHMEFYQYLASGLSFLSMPDFLLGMSAAQNGTAYSNIFASNDWPGQTERDYFIWNPWFYAQDDFKLNSRLTFNLGLRYERLGDFADSHGRNGGFDIKLADPNPSASGSTAGYVLPSNFPGTIPPGSIRLNNKFALKGDGQDNFGPRIGFAWQILPKSSRFVLRGGYGIYYSALIGQQVLNDAVGPPWTIFRFVNGTPNAAATWAKPFGQLYSLSDFPLFPAYSPTTQYSQRALAQDTRPPITQQYSMNLQTQLAHDYLLEIGYLGARATHLVELVSQNQAGLASPSNPIRGETTNTLANLHLRVPIQGFTASGIQSIQTQGESWYNALQVSLTKRFSHGLQFLASYTFARLFDTEGGETNNAGVANSFIPGDQNDPGLRYGPSSTVRPHRFTVSFVYELPKVARGGFAGEVLNNWTITGVTTILSGHPLTLLGLNANNVLGTNGYGWDRPEWASGCTKSRLATGGAVDKKLNNYFNHSCIGSYPVVGDDGIATGFGNMGPGLVNGPAESNLDLALIKRFPVSWFGHESNLEFRAESFNTFNTPHFSDPDTNVADGAGFGVISSTIASPRIIQFALKYNF